MGINKLNKILAKDKTPQFFTLHSALLSYIPFNYHGKFLQKISYQSV